MARSGTRHMFGALGLEPEQSPPGAGHSLLKVPDKAGKKASLIQPVQADVSLMSGPSVIWYWPQVNAGTFLLANNRFD